MAYPYSAHFLDKVGESSQTRPAIPRSAPLIEAKVQDRYYDETFRNEDDEDDEVDEERALYENAWTEGEGGITITAHMVQETQHTQHQHQHQHAVGSPSLPLHQPQMPSVPPLQMGLVPEPILRKRKAWHQLLAGNTNGATSETINQGVSDEAAWPIVQQVEVPRSELEWARINNREEADAVFIAQQVRRANLHQSTQKAYDKYREHWKAWCVRHRYRDGSVTNSRVARYFKECFGEGDPLNPDVQPLRKKKPRTDALKDYYMPETIDFYIKAVVDLWTEQATSAPNGVWQGAETSPRKIAKPFMEAYKRKIGSLTKATEFQGLRVTEGYNAQGFKRMMKSFWTRNYVQLDQKNRRKLNGLRDRLNLSWTHFMMCRGENMRMALLQDLNFHAFEFSDATGQFTLGVVLTMLQGKMNADGKLPYGVVVRNKDVEICPVGSLAFYLFELFMDPRTCPDFSKPDWPSNYLVFARNPGQQMSSSTHYSAQKSEMQAANVLSSKATHAGRRAGTQQAQSTEATIEEIAQHGNWLHQRVATHYLNEIPELVPLKLAGFTQVQERFWIARNTVIPPVELQKLVFPVLNNAYPDKDWETWMENIMMDQDEYNGHGLDQRLVAKYPQHDSQKIKFFIVLAHLRKVVLQDAAALMEINGDPQCQYHLHRIFHEPVFRLPMFIEFQAALREKIAMLKSPISDSLHANTPAIQHGLRDISEKMTVATSMLKTIPTTTDMHHDRDVWPASIAQQMNHMRSDMVTMHNGIITVNNNIGSSLISFQNVLKQILVTATETLARTELTIAQIPAMPFASEMLPSTLQQPTQQQLQPQPQPLPPSVQDQPRSPLLSQLPFTEDESHSPPHSPPHSLPPRSPSPLSQPQLPSMEAGPVKDDLVALAERLAWPRDKPVISSYTMKDRPRTIDPIWQEWFHGVDGEPSIWQMNKYYKWRKNASAAARKHYGFNRLVIESALKAILEVQEPTLDLRKEAGLLVVKQKIAQAGSLNQYYLQLSRGIAAEKALQKARPQ